MAGDAVNPAVFRAYDIRGVVDIDLPEGALATIGRAAGTLFRSQGRRRLVVGRDARSHSPRLQAALIGGLRASGIDVVDLGEVPTPLVAFAVAHLGADGGAVVSASHNPPRYNGVKLRAADPRYGSAPLSSADIQEICRIANGGDFADGPLGALERADVADAYLASVAALVRLPRPMLVVLDGGNGVAGPLGVRALEACGAQVVPLFIEPDGGFPHHPPDPSKPQHLAGLSRLVVERGADLGIALDGDGDRLGVVDHTGAVVAADRALIVLAQYLLTGQRAAVVSDVMCSPVLEQAVRAFGGEPVRCKTGYTHLTAAVRAADAVLGGERSGHIIAATEPLHNYDDGVFAAARLLEAVARLGAPLARLLEPYPALAALPDERLPCADDRKFRAIDHLRTQLAAGQRVTTLDGVRLDTDDGWGIVRASNTEPLLTARFEGRTTDDAGAIRALMLGIVEAFLKQG